MLISDLLQMWPVDFTDKVKINTYIKISLLFSLHLKVSVTSEITLFIIHDLLCMQKSLKQLSVLAAFHAGSFWPILYYRKTNAISTLNNLVQARIKTNVNSILVLNLRFELISIFYLKSVI